MSAVVNLMALPLLWGLVVFVVRAAAVRRRPVFPDAIEKLLLGLMLVPFVAGLLLLILPVPVQTFWALGAIIALFRLGHAHLRFARIAAKATPLGNGVYQTQAVVPAFAWNRRRIVVPQSLSDAMTTDQFNLIVEHERAHQRRHDPLWFLVLGVVEAMLWFNPLLRLQVRACRLAAELACDAAVTQAAPEKRRLYAETLLRTITAASGLPATIPALSDLATCKMRLETIMTARHHRKPLSPSRP